jgi:hypothetical protein
MKIMIRGALVALSIANISPAFASEGDGRPNTLFTERPGVVAPVQNSSAAAAQSDASSAHTPWLFPPIGKYLDQHTG